MLQIPFVPGEPDWTEGDAAFLRTFLLSPTGQLFLRRLHWARPNLAISHPAADRQARVDALIGHEGAITEILLLAENRTQLTAEDRAAQSKT